MPARRHTQVFAVACLLIAVAGGGYAARSLVHSDAAPTAGANIITCPLTAHGWTGRVTGLRPPATAPIREAKIVVLVNAFRHANGRGTLRADRALSDAARAHSLDMVQRAYFGHDAPGQGGLFGQRLARYTPRTCIAENIAWGTGPYGTAAGIVTAWKQSPGHRTVMLLPWVTRIGVGVSTGRFQGAAGAAVATADFAG